MPRLDFYSQFKLYVKFQLGTGETLLGRGKGCEIQLPMQRVSRQHAAIRPADKDDYEYEIENLSVNGTRLNAAMLEKATALFPGDRIYIADYCIIYQSDDTPSEEFSEKRTVHD